MNHILIKIYTIFQSVYSKHNLNVSKTVQQRIVPIMDSLHFGQTEREPEVQQS